MDQSEQLSHISDIVEELYEEDIEQVVLERLKLFVHVLSEPIDLSLRVDRCRQILEELDERSDIDMFVRTQLWNVSALIEQL